MKKIIKEMICRTLNVPFNRYGLPNSLIKYLPKDQDITVADIGAHDGYFTRVIHEYCGISKGVLVEALPEKAEQLRKTYAPPRFFVYECAASAENGIIEFEVNEARETSSMLRIRRDLTELSKVNLGTRTVIHCQSKRLDDIAAEARLETIDLLKLDVQGAEHLVLQGAPRCISNTSLVWTECSFKPLYELSSDFAALYHLFSALGFKLMEVEAGFRGPDGELLQCDALFMNQKNLR